jgi:alanyl-tRNA synthetase
MNARNLRQSFLDFFASKQHTIVPSAPMVVKGDPTLMFTNAGMNQFKDIFLGNSPVTSPRVADSQKCLRVSGKHNDLEEVGHDTYHHTMFEMLGNWSFGDYFKKDAIDWAWEYLTKVLKIDPTILYATVFEGDKKDGTEFDKEAFDIWKQYLPEERILMGNKKDNFWEMGESGPCGPCSEIHVDIRSAEEKQKISGKDLVNNDHPHVIEIWNLVFIQYNRKANGSLELLPNKHVDTGMGFERLAMVVQGKQSNYDTDVFQPLIQEIATISSTIYGKNTKQDIAMRVIADHIRTISFAIADGQLPSNIKAGYVIRRILRRAVRYGYTFLNLQEPFLYRLLPSLIQSMGNAYPELVSQEKLITKVIFEEEKSFLRTLATGIQLLNTIIEKTKNSGKTIISGNDAFTLYDTYGFPFDLTMLIAKENNIDVDQNGFQTELEKQKDRARLATNVSTGDWIEITKGNGNSFIGYDTTQASVSIIKYRKVNSKNKDLFQIVFDQTPFYSESGGQVGDSGYIESLGKKTYIIDTQKENNLIIHISETLPEDVNTEFQAVVNEKNRTLTASNHSATHLLHLALQEILGSHVEQKGSLVNPERLRFDFAHFQKMTAEEIRKAEILVNESIRKNIALQEYRETPIESAKKMGAKALFGEKYGDSVRVIQFEKSIELCGGTHIDSTGKIGFFKIISEGAIAAGIRRIEAITADQAEKFIFDQVDIISSIREILKSPSNIVTQVEQLSSENSQLKKQLESFEKQQTIAIAQELLKEIEVINNITILIKEIEVSNANALKDIAFNLKEKLNSHIIVLATKIDGKAQIAIATSKDIIDTYKISAQDLIKTASKEIEGGGGGQPFFATAGGKNTNGISKALSSVRQQILSL